MLQLFDLFQQIHHIPADSPNDSAGIREASKACSQSIREAHEAGFKGVKHRTWYGYEGFSVIVEAVKLKP